MMFLILSFGVVGGKNIFQGPVLLLGMTCFYDEIRCIMLLSCIPLDPTCISHICFVKHRKITGNEHDAMSPMPDVLDLLV